VANPTMFKCHDCQMISHHPMDVRWNYCGNCHEWKDRNAIFPVIDDRPGDPPESSLREELRSVGLVIFWMLVIGIIILSLARFF
jgi:hypothetical protein